MLPLSYTYVKGNGDLNSKIAIVGEQPGKREVLLGKVFSGPAGDNLNECLSIAGIPRSTCYLTNVIKDFDNGISHYIDIKPKKATRVSPEGESYIDILKDELHECKANVIVACGNIALFALTQRVGITQWRGSVLESTLLPGRKVIPIIHPATYTWEKLLKNPSAYLNRYLISLDLTRVKKESEYPGIQRIPRKLIIKPSFGEALEFLAKCESALRRGEVVDYDIELYNMELSCIGFALSPSESMCIPFIGPEGDYYTADQEVTIMSRIEQIMSNPQYKKRGQYVIFDSHFLLRKYGIRTHNLEDTMIAQKILYPEFRVGLDFITAMWTDLPYYKQDGKIWLGGAGEWENGWRYNCLDTIATADAFPKQFEELLEESNKETYERQVKLIEPLTYMMERGICVNTQGMQDDYITHGVRINELQQQLNELAGRELNSNSPKQLIQYFYVEKRLPPYVKNKSLTVNEDALKRIALKGHKEASLILNIRKLVKRKGTYLVTDKIDPDGRIRCSYNPVGTKFSRISSSENIFGTGANLQNWPNDLLSYLTPDPGYIFYSFDLSQFENRVVAYVGNIPQMIQVFENNLDSHRMTASLILNKPYEEISNEEGSSPLGNGERSERYWGKTANHAFNYGFGARSYSIKYEVPEAQAKWIHDKYHSAYPGLQNNYWTYVQNCLKDNRTLTNLFGRKVKFYGQWGEKLFHVAYSCIPQGTCGDLINERGINFIYYNQEKFSAVELLTQIHDSIGFQVPLSVSLKDHAEILLRIKDSLSQPLEFHGRSFDVPVDLTIGFTLNKADGKEFKGANLPTTTYELSSLLEKVIDEKLVST